MKAHEGGIEKIAKMGTGEERVDGNERQKFRSVRG